MAKDPLPKFNRNAWCTDMAGANLAGISKVYGDSSQIKLCDFHFKDHHNKRAQKVAPESAEEFKGLYDNLLYSTITVGYALAKKNMDNFINAKEDKTFLANWVYWWHDRCCFIFRTFTS